MRESQGMRLIHNSTSHRLKYLGRSTFQDRSDSVWFFVFSILIIACSIDQDFECCLRGEAAFVSSAVSS